MKQNEFKVEIKSREEKVITVKNCAGDCEHQAVIIEIVNNDDNYDRGALVTGITVRTHSAEDYQKMYVESIIELCHLREIIDSALAEFFKLYPTYFAATHKD